MAWQGKCETTGHPTATMRSPFLAIRVRPASWHIRRTHGHLPDAWLVAEWPPDTAEPVTYRLSNMASTPLKVLVRLPKIRWRIEHDYRELTAGLGR